MCPRTNGLDVFQIDPAKGRLHQRNGFDELVGILGIELDVDRIDVGKALEQHRLAFHHRLRGERAKVAHAKDRSAIRNHRDQVALGGIFIGIGGIVGDRLNRHGNAWRIGQRQIALGRHRLRGNDLDFSGANGLVIKQRFAFGELDPGFV